MKLLALILLPAIACPLCMSGQNTGAQATPQTQNATPAGISGAGTPPSTQPNGSRTPRTGTAAGKGTARRGRPQARSAAPSATATVASPAPAADSSVTVIGGNKLNPISESAEGVTLPGIAMLHNALGIAAGTPIHLRLQQAVDSGHAKNGDTVKGVLTAALGSLPSGAPVTLTVVAAAPAGDVGSGGTLSLQVISVNGEQLLSEVITAEGKQGQTLLPDAAPARGTEAVFTPEMPITVPAA